MILSSMSKNGALLAAFALLTTGAVALVEQFSAPHIKLQEKKQLVGMLQQVMPQDDYDNELYLDCVQLSDPQLGPGTHTAYRARKQGRPVALVVESTTPNGYSGNIDLLSAVYRDGTVAGARVIKHNETPGLGDKVETKRSDWVLGFSGQRVESDKDARWAVKKDGGMFDQFTGATITPRAVVGAVKDTALYVSARFDDLFAGESQCKVEGL